MSSYRPMLTFCFIITAVFTDAAEVSKCYRVNNEQYCFYSGGLMSSWDTAREFCESKNSTLPIIRDENTDRVSQQFLDDSYNVTQNRSVWINAHPVNDSVGWHWINGQQSDLSASDFLEHSDNNWRAAIGTSNGTAVLYSSNGTDNQHYICQYSYDNDTISTTSSVNCSARWIVYPQSAARGANWAGKITQRQCLDKCVADTRCVAAEWSSHQGCWHHINRGYQRQHDARVTQFEIIRQCNPMSDSSCNNAFVLNSQCYKVHSTERIPWFTAVNRCLSNNASLAVFDDNVRQYFPSSVLPDKAWIGLLKSWWTWPDGSDVLYNKFNPPPHPNSNYSCVVAAADQWTVSRCDDEHLVTCQSDVLIPVTTTTTTTTMTTTTTTMTSTTTVATTTVLETTTSEVATTSSSAGANDTGGDDVGLAVGLVFFFIIILVVIVVVVCVILRRRHRRSRPSRDQSRHLEQQIQQRHSGGDRETANIYMNGVPDCVYATIVPSSQPTAGDDHVTPGGVVYSTLRSSGVGDRNRTPDENETVYANVL